MSHTATADRRLACKHPKYNDQFPESFNWELLESPKLTALANDLARTVRHELAKPAALRSDTLAGLRHALRRIASTSEVWFIESL